MDEQTRWNYMEAELESAENKVRGLEAALKQQTAYCKKCCRDNKYSPQLIATENKVRELGELLDEWTNTPFFENQDEWLEWVNEYGPRVESALNR